MPVRDLMLSGSAQADNSNAVSTTIQPAAGTMFSFKRGLISSYVPAYGRGGEFSIIANSSNFVIANVVTTNVAILSTFTMLSFCEGGVTGHYRAALSGDFTGMQNSNVAATPFAAISNLMPLTIRTFSVNAGLTTMQYNLIGVSMT